MADKQKLSDETVKKVAGGDIPVGKYCPNCKVYCLWSGPKKFYCPTCGYIEYKS